MTGFTLAEISRAYQFDDFALTKPRAWQLRSVLNEHGYTVNNDLSFTRHIYNSQRDQEKLEDILEAAYQRLNTLDIPFINDLLIWGGIPLNSTESISINGRSGIIPLGFILEAMRQINYVLKVLKLSSKSSDIQHLTDRESRLITLSGHYQNLVDEATHRTVAGIPALISVAALAGIKLFSAKTLTTTLLASSLFLTPWLVLPMLIPIGLFALEVGLRYFYDYRNRRTETIYANHKKANDLVQGVYNHCHGLLGHKKVTLDSQEVRDLINLSPPFVKPRNSSPRLHRAGLCRFFSTRHHSVNAGLAERDISLRCRPTLSAQ